MKKLPAPAFSILFALGLLLAFSGAEAKPKAAQQIQKERLVLMPLRLGEEDQNLQGAMEMALVKGLQQKYEVFFGEQVAKKAREIFMKESRNTTKKECDETRCLQGIAEAFQAELLATANITKQDGGYFIALSVQNLFDNKVVQSESIACEGCNAFKVVEKLKELVGTPAPVATAPVAEPPPPKINQNDPDAVLWAEVQKGNSVDDYQVYLDTYPKGKYLPLAKARIKKLKDEALAAAEQQEQSAWDAAQQGSSEDSYALYLKGYPNGRFAGLAKVRLDKLKSDLAARAEAELWKKVESGNDKSAVEAYLNKYPAGRYLAQATAKLQAIKEEEAKGPTMVRIPGKNYELGKYHVTKGEFAKFVSETGYDAGNECWIWTDKWEKKTGYNWRNPGYSQDDSHPATCVNWNDAQAYATWLSKKTGKQYRLPIESEWEYACYGGSQTEYCGSNDINVVAWYKDNSNNATHPVGQKQANGYGLYDMSGNLWQWMENKYDDKNDGRSLRGGSWNYFPRYVRAASRGSSEPSNRSSDYGFRLARTLP